MPAVTYWYKVLLLAVPRGDFAFSSASRELGCSKLRVCGSIPLSEG